MASGRPARIDRFGLEPDQRLGAHYEVVEELGKGWEGEVYKVRELGTEIERAAKLYYPQRNPRGKALLQYARKLYKLRDVPIVIQYHHRDRARVRGHPVEFMVSDYVDGEMLSAFVERQPGRRLLPFEALHLMHALAEGVSPIHLAGEYHGDVHSDNVLVRRRGLGFEVRLLDFFDLGRPTKAKIADDVVDMAGLLYEIIGGRARYCRAPPQIKQFVCGRRRGLIHQRYPTAGALALALENLEWP
jgi:serine/threonine protein kinase